MRRYLTVIAIIAIALAQTIDAIVVIRLVKRVDELEKHSLADSVKGNLPLTKGDFGPLIKSGECISVESINGQNWIKSIPCSTKDKK